MTVPDLVLALQDAEPASIFTLERVFLGLWVVMSVLFYFNWRRDETPHGSVLKVGLLLGFIYGLIALVRWSSAPVGADEQVILMGLLGAGEGASGPRVPLLHYLLMAGGAAVIGTIIWYARDKVGTVSSVILSTWDRGHWYLLPCLFIMLTVGLLLAAALAAPALSPFIYTLF